MTRAKKIATCDCETDPFEHGFDIQPFIWGFYDGKLYREFHSTEEFVEFVRPQNIILYAHNGGKFDFMFLLKYLRETRAQIINGRFVSLYLGLCELRDSYAIIPVALKELGGKKDIEHWKLCREHREKYRVEIGEYLYWDCKSLYDGVKAYREKAGKYKTIASNALAFSRKIGVDPGKTNARFDADFRPFYYGGRTECFQPGVKTDGYVIDIHSAYPFAMSHHHATGNDFLVRSNLNGLSHDEINRSFIKVECYSHGAFPKRFDSSKNGSAENSNPNGLFFPRGFDTYYVTGWEYQTALSLGLLSDIRIKSVRHTKNTITFKPYVEYWYAYKNAHSAKDASGKRLHPVDYTIGKIMMNSLYGKLAQNPAKYKDYKIVAAGEEIGRYVEETVTLKSGRKKLMRHVCKYKNRGDGLCEHCKGHADEHGWTLEFEYEGHEIHARESLWKWKHQFGVEWESKNLYKNVATGASITGFTRAHLLRAIATIGFEHVIYCDTDGIVCGRGADLSQLPFNDDLGAWELEGNFSEGHFGGKKLYAMKMDNGKDKIASKGARLEFDHIKKIVAGETVEWKSPAPTFHIDGSFDYIVRKIRTTATKALNATSNT